MEAKVVMLIHEKTDFKSKMLLEIRDSFLNDIIIYLKDYKYTFS